MRPTDVGFDTETGGEIKGVGNGANFWPYVFRDQPVRWLDFQENKLGEDEYLVDRMNHEAIQFIERNQKEPFFLYLSHYSTHSILNGRPDKVKKYIANDCNHHKREEEISSSCKYTQHISRTCSHFSSGSLRVVDFSSFFSFHT